MKSFPFFLPAIVLATGLAAQASAATLVLYSMGSASLSTAPTTIGGVNATSLTAGSGVTFQNSGVVMGTSTARALGLSGTGVAATETDAITAGRTITFTLTATAGQALTLQTFTMNANLGGPLLSPEFSVRVNTGSGFTVAGTGAITSTSAGSGTPFDAINVPLTEPTLGAFSNLTGTVTVQVVFYDTTTPAATWTDWVRMDDMAINGTVTPVPEVGSALLVVSGAALAMMRRRRA
jgi:hypothetical protein